MQEHTLFNHTQINSSSTRYPVSSYSQRNNVSAAPSLYDTSGNLGYGVGRLLREAFDRLYNGWQQWWYPAPSKEMLAQRRQVAIYRKRLEAAMWQLDLAVEDLRKNPRAKNSFERFKQIVKESKEYLSPAPTEKLRHYQRGLLNQLRTKIEGLNVKGLSRTLLTYLLALPSEATSITDTADSHVDMIKDASSGKRKRSVAMQPASEFQASFDLTTLNGTNGFVVNGISSKDQLGFSVSTAGDINGDGKSDLVLGADGVSNNTGAAYVIFGQSSFPSPFNLTTLNGTNGFVVNGMISSNNYLGTSVSTAGDINGDGKSDIVVGAPWDFNTDSPPGAVYVIFGRSSFPSPFNLTTLNGTNGFVVNGISRFDNLGWSVSTAGDINGDGRTDLVLGAPGFGAASAYVIFGQSNFPSAFNLTTLNGTNGFRLTRDYSLGFSVSTAGDINGDGKSDLVVGAPAYLVLPNQPGSAYVIFGQSSFPPIFNLATLNGTNGFAVKKYQTNDALGNSVSTAGDINGDGKTDLVLGAPGSSNAYVIFGQSSFPRTFNLATLNGTNGFVMNGISYDRLGSSISTAGDINGDGKTDLVLGANWASNKGGAAYVIFGQSSFPPIFNLATLNGTNGFVMNGISNGDYLGSSVNAAGDVNGDGKTDLMLGAPRASSLAGAAYVIFNFNATTPTPTANSTTNSLATAPIIGGVVGGLFGLSSLLGLGYVLYRRHSSKPKLPVDPQADRQPNTELTPLVVDKNSNSSNDRPLNRNEYRGVFFPLVQEEEKVPYQENTEENPHSKLTKLL